MGQYVLFTVRLEMFWMNMDVQSVAVTKVNFTPKDVDKSEYADKKWKESEGLLLNSNSLNFQLNHGENKLIFNEMMMRFALICTRSTCSFGFL